MYKTKQEKVEAIPFVDTAECLKEISNMVEGTIKVDYSIKPPILKIFEDSEDCFLPIAMDNWVIKLSNGQIVSCPLGLFGNFFEEVKNV